MCIIQGARKVPVRLYKNGATLWWKCWRPIHTTGGGGLLERSRSQLSRRQTVTSNSYCYHKYCRDGLRIHCAVQSERAFTVLLCIWNQNEFDLSFVLQRSQLIWDKGRCGRLPQWGTVDVWKDNETKFLTLLCRGVRWFMAHSAQLVHCDSHSVLYPTSDVYTETFRSPCIVLVLPELQHTVYVFMCVFIWRHCQ